MSARAAIYLDANAGAPLRRSVVETLRRLFDPASDSLLFPNASSIHSHGRRGKKWIAEARERIAFSLGQRADPEQIIFTSSGTEANQLAVRSVLEPRLRAWALEPGVEKPHWITTPVEHDSVRQLVKWFEERGGEVSLLPVDEAGAPVSAALNQMLRPTTALVSCVWVNNETGVITEVGRLARSCHDQRVPLHLDGAQAWGKIPVDVVATGAQLVSFSPHKIGGLAGLGVLWVGKGMPLTEGLIIGKQEKGRRGGTENLVGIVAAGLAAAELDPLSWAARVGACRDRLEATLRERIKGMVVNGGGAPRVANTLNLSFEGVEGDGLVMALDLAGYSVSSGSACASGVLEPSHVLLAMGRSRAQAMAAVRVSLAGELTPEEMEGFVGALSRAVDRVRGASPRSAFPKPRENGEMPL